MDSTHRVVIFYFLTMIGERRFGCLRSDKCDNAVRRPGKIHWEIMSYLKKITANIIFPVPFAPVSAMDGLNQHLEAVGFYICFTAGYSEGTLVRTIETGMIDIR